MYKVIVLFSIFIILPSLALADTFTLDASSVSGASDLIIETSSQVTLVYADGTDGATFAVATAHGKGTRQYMSTSEDALIYWGDQTSGTPDTPTAPAVGTSVGSGANYPQAM